MHEVLRAEEQEDIAHRDRCEGSVAQNKFRQEDLDHAVKKLETEIARMENEETKLQDKITTLDTDINTTKANMVDLKEMRAKEHSEFVQAIKDDAEAVKLLEEAIRTLSEFYRSNGIKLDLRQTAAQKPEYSNAPPDTSWKEGGYGDRSSEAGGIVAILS